MSGTLRQISPELWVIDHDLAVGGLRLGTRTTILRLPDGGLLLHSPGPLDEAMVGQIRALGAVRALVAPNTMHHMYLSAAKASFPEARTYGSPGLQKKLPDLALDETLGEKAPAAWGDIRLLPVNGMPAIAEIALFHAASGALLLTDMCFNVQKSEHWFTNTAMWMNDGLDRFGPTRAARFMIKDKTAMRRTVDGMIALSPRVITVTHGAVLQGDGAAALKTAYAFLG